MAVNPSESAFFRAVQSDQVWAGGQGSAHMRE